MTLKQNNLLKYKYEKMDKISKSFCAAKWNNATIWLGSGETTSCHHPPQHQINKESLKDNPSHLHNTDIKKNDRKLMLKGERPKGCEYCWIIEDMEKDAISDRIFKTNIYSDENLTQIANSDPSGDFDLKTIEIAFDRNCNFACIYCNATFSTSWGLDINTNGPYKGLIDPDGLTYALNGSGASPYPDESKNPYLSAFWKWWPSLQKSLQEIRVTGGEPLLSHQMWKLLKECEPLDLSVNINSNLGVKKNLIEKLIIQSHTIKNLSIYTSCEATDAQSEYIRNGISYAYFLENLEEVIKRGNLKSVNVMMTVNCLSIFSMTQFLDKMLELKKTHGPNKPTWTVNLLRFPSFLSVTTLPKDIKERYASELKVWLAKNNSPLLLDHEIAGLSRLIHYLTNVEKPHHRSTDLITRKKDLRVFLKQFDLRRGLSYEKTFPEHFTHWLKSEDV